LIATSLCFAEKSVFTQEILAIVMQNLMDVNPLPTLLMRTVIQSLTTFPRLIAFIMNILQRLILKKVWHQKTQWEGFIKCCQKTKPNSFQVLLQLPPEQLEDVLYQCPEMRKSLLDHVLSFTEVQVRYNQLIKNTFLKLKCIFIFEAFTHSSNNYGCCIWQKNGSTNLSKFKSEM